VTQSDVIARRVLLLGGTTEATQLAAELAKDEQIKLIVSLAGRTARPLVRNGELRTGGFGGADGLARYLAEEAIALVVDATHPFAAVMPFNAASACQRGRRATPQNLPTRLGAG
jgi:precorrin-6A/cobalt-precorrin-6A reductase